MNHIVTCFRIQEKQDCKLIRIRPDFRSCRTEDYARSLSRSESQPELLQLQEEISDLENKLAAVRRYFNSATKELNNAVETFPSNLIAGMFGFKKDSKKHLKSSSKDAIRRYTNPTEQEQFPFPCSCFACFPAW